MLSWFPKLPLKDGKKKGSKDASGISLDNNKVQHDEVHVFSPGNPRLIRSRNFRRHLKQLDRSDLLSPFPDSTHAHARLDRLPSVSEPTSPRRTGYEFDVSKFNGTSQSQNDLHTPRQSDGASLDRLTTSDMSTSPESDVQDNGSYWLSPKLEENQASVFISQAQSMPMKTLNVLIPSHLDNSSDKANHMTDREKNGRVVYGSAQVTPRAMVIEPSKIGVTGYSSRHQINNTRTRTTVLSSMPTSPIRSPNASISSYHDINRVRPRKVLDDHVWIQEKTTLESLHKASFETPGSQLYSPKLLTPYKTPLESPRRTPLASPRLASPHKTPLQSPRRSPLSSPKGRNNVSPDPWLYDDPQHSHAHPLPPPPDSQRSPRSTAPSPMNPNRFDDSGRFDAPSPSNVWPRSPGKGDTSNGKWIKGALLGSGSFGKVYKGIHSETGDLCAIKEVELVGDDPRSKESAKQLSQEVAVLSTLRHPNILHYKGSEMVENSLYIYLELVSGGSIYKLLHEFEGKFPEPIIRRYTRQILLGLEYLHDKKTVHRDIKCANVLVDQDGVVKLADFGMAKLIGDDIAPLSFKGSPYWMAPEVILQNNAGFEFAVDIWGLGCTVIEMATGKPPWFQYEGYAAMFKVMNCHDVPIPDSLSPLGQNFIKLCLQRDPSKRPTASSLLCHPYMQLDSPMPSNGATLSQAVVERITFRDREGDRVHRDMAIGRPPASSASTAITPRSNRTTMSGPVSPRHYFQVPLHTSQSDMNLLSSQQVAYNRGHIQVVDEYGIQGSSRSRTTFPSKRFAGPHDQNFSYHGWNTVKR